MGAVASPAELDKALTVLAYYGGNCARASKQLGIPRSTLNDWKAETHRDRYLEIAEREAPRLEAMAAQHARETILRAGQAEHALFDILEERLEEAETPEPQRNAFTSDSLFEAAYRAWLHRGSSKELSELAGTVQRISTAKGINGTKLLELTGRPTSIVEHRDPREEGLKLLKRYGITVDATATEIPADQLPAAPVSRTEILPLPVESGTANARDKSVSPAVKPAAD